MQKKAIFIAATGQHVGKTTLCLGLIAALQKKFSKVGFMKPVGQQHERVENGLRVDKDVILFKEYFSLTSAYADMSPVIFPAGFTRDFLDGRISLEPLKAKIKSSFEKISNEHDFTLVEGTGHMGVGSIVHLDNAVVSKLLNTEVVLVAKGGLGSAYDELALNKAVCDQHGVKIRGVILNRVYEEKKEMVVSYISKALKRWDIPLIGAIPFDKLLNAPSLEDFESLFNTSLLSGQQHHYLHFETIRLVASSVETIQELPLINQLIMTPATREDIILKLIDHHTNVPHVEPDFGLILTGHKAPAPHIIEKLKKAAIPSLYVDKTSFETMQQITLFTAKIRKEDISKVQHAIELIESNVNLNQLSN